MSEKNRDNQKRWRSITVGFRVSPQESDTINMMVLTSGLTSKTTAPNDYFVRTS